MELKRKENFFFFKSYMKGRDTDVNFKNLKTEHLEVIIFKYFQAESEVMAKGNYIRKNIGILQVFYERLNRSHLKT